MLRFLVGFLMLASAAPALAQGAPVSDAPPAALPASGATLTAAPPAVQQPAALVPAPMTAEQIAAAKAKAQVQAQADMQKLMYTVNGVPATYANVVKAAIRFGALDMSSDAAVDDFAQIFYCDIFQKYHGNEFDWRRVRAAMRKKIDLDKSTYPDTLYLERVEYFGEYDFSTGMLPLTAASMMQTRRLLLADAGNTNYCGESIHLPLRLEAELSEPLRLEGVELTEDEARTVVAGLAQRDINGPPTRIAYGRYTVQIIGGEPAQGSNEMPRLKSNLQNVTLYEDPDYLRPFWSGLSSFKINSQQQGELDQLKFKGIDPTDEHQLGSEKPLTIGPAK